MLGNNGEKLPKPNEENAAIVRDRAGRVANAVRAVEYVKAIQYPEDDQQLTTPSNSDELDIRTKHKAEVERLAAMREPDTTLEDARDLVEEAMRSGRVLETTNQGIIPNTGDKYGLSA